MEPLSSTSRLDVLKAANPWWTPPHRHDSPTLPPRPRPMASLLIELISGGQAVWLFGPRGTGKTVLVHQILMRFLSKGLPAGNVCYLPCDHPALIHEEPDQMLALWSQAVAGIVNTAMPRFLFVDVPMDHLPALSRLAVTPEAGVVMVIASSCTPPALETNAETGARIRPLYLPPFTFPEYTSRAETPFGARHENDELLVSPELISTLNQHFDNYLRLGGFPGATSQVFASDALASLMPTTVMMNRSSISSSRELWDLMLVLAREDGNQVSPEWLAQATGLAKNTIRKYLTFLEETMVLRVVHRVNKWGARLRRARSFRVFLAHPCMRYLLLGGTADAELLGHQSAGALMTQLPPSARLVEYAWSENGLGLAHLNPGRKLKTNERVAWAMEVTQRDINLDPSDLVTFCRVHRLDRALMTTGSYFHFTQLNGVAVHQLPLSLQCYVLGYRLMFRKGLKITPVEDQPDPTD